MKAGEESELRLLLTEHIGAVVDRVMAEGPRQAGQHHLVSIELLPQTTGFVEIFFDVIAVGAEHNEVAALDEIAEGVGHKLTAAAMATHLEHGLHVLVVHRFNGFSGEGSQQVPTRTRG